MQLIASKRTRNIYYLQTEEEMSWDRAETFATIIKQAAPNNVEDVSFEPYKGNPLSISFITIQTKGYICPDSLLKAIIKQTNIFQSQSAPNFLPELEEVCSTPSSSTPPLEINEDPLTPPPTVSLAQYQALQRELAELTEKYAKLEEEHVKLTEENAKNIKAAERMADTATQAIRTIFNTTTNPEARNDSLEYRLQQSSWNKRRRVEKNSEQQSSLGEPASRGVCSPTVINMNSPPSAQNAKNLFLTLNSS